MLQFSQYALYAAIALTVLAIAGYVISLIMVSNASAVPAQAPVAVGKGGVAVADRPTPAEAPNLAGAAAMAEWGTHFMRLSVLMLLACLTARGLATGHGPFANQYEFSVSFAFGVIAVFAFFEWRYRVRTLGLVALPVALAMMLYAIVGTDPNPTKLVPALQNGWLLTTHVAVAIPAYGAFAVSFGAAVLYLISPEHGLNHLPKPEVLDRLGYKAVMIGFPMQTLVIVLGAIWADIAWGTYWSWDPKETASLVTWLCYGAYLHARVARGWVGKGSAWLLILAFATVILTFFGNLFFGGLHSYGGM